MNVLVTGAGGFVGRHVVAALREAGHAVRAVDRSPREATLGVERVTADLATSENLEPLFDGIDVLIHLAASMRGSLDQMMSNTVGGTQRLLDAMSRTATRRVVLASSFTVYDRAKIHGVLTETSAVHDDESVKACDRYAQVKVRQELLTRDLARQHGWTLTVLRPGVIWGRDMWSEFLIGMRIGPLQTVVAPGAPVRLAYVENVADAFVKAAERTGSDELIVNVVDDPVTTAWQYATVVKRRMGGVLVPVPYGMGLLKAKVASLLTGGSTRLPYFLQPARFAALHQPLQWTNQRLREALGWSPRYTFDQAVARATGRAG